MGQSTLVVGLGGALGGDDAVGLELAHRLAADPRLPAGVDVLIGGPDLLRVGPALAGRGRILLLDALAARPGETRPLVADHPLPGLDARQSHAHHLSAVQALDLLLLAEPELARTRITWFLIPVSSATPGQRLSPDLAARLPALLQDLLAVL